MTTNQDVSPRSQARVAGILYLLIFITAGFSEGYVRSTLVVPGDPAATATNILGSEALFRLGLVSDLVAFLADAAVAVLFYVLLRPAGRTFALLALTFRLIAHPAIAALNLVHHHAALLFLKGGPSLSALGEPERESLALLAMNLHRYGYLIGGAFFGVHCVLLGILLYRSERFPEILGILLGVAAVGYLFETSIFFLAPAYESIASTVVVVTAVTGELALCLYLLIRGTRTPAMDGAAASIQTG